MVGIAIPASCADVWKLLWHSMGCSEHKDEIEQILDQRAQLADTGRLQEIVPLDEQLVNHYRLSGNTTNVAWALARQASILRRLGRLDAAEDILREQEQVCLTAPPQVECFDLEIGADLVCRVEELLKQLKEQRAKLLVKDGRTLPIIHIKDNGALVPTAYRVFAGGYVVGNACADPKFCLAVWSRTEKPPKLPRWTGSGRRFDAGTMHVDDRFDGLSTLQILPEGKRTFRLRGWEVYTAKQVIIKHLTSIADSLLIRPWNDSILPAEFQKVCTVLVNIDGLIDGLEEQAAIAEERENLDDALSLYKRAERLCLAHTIEIETVTIELGKDLKCLLRTPDENNFQKKIENFRYRLEPRLGSGRLPEITAFVAPWVPDGEYRVYFEGIQIATGSIKPGRCLVLLEEKYYDLPVEAITTEPVSGRLAAWIPRETLECQEFRELKVFQPLTLMFNHLGHLLRHWLVELKTLEDPSDEEIPICRSLCDTDCLFNLLLGEAWIHMRRGAVAAAASMTTLMEEIQRNSGDLDQLRAVLGTRASILGCQDAFEAALAMHRQEEQVCRDVGMKIGIARSLSCQAAILLELDRWESAAPLLREQQRLLGEVGEVKDLFQCIIQQALLETEAYCGDEALLKLQNRECFCRESGDGPGTVRSLIMQAALWASEMESPLRSLPLAEEAAQLVNGLGEDALAQEVESVGRAVRSLLPHPE
jgi:tetratricopeptide (TPR) repeat protein